ncbi:hypothetical protein WA158_005144 [Blastocystis sp. Blastoise]
MDPISVVVILGIAATALIVLIVKVIIIWVETCQRDRRHRNGIWSADEDHLRVSREDLPSYFTILTEDEIHELISHDDSDFSECVICLESFKDNHEDSIVKLKACGHNFHQRCISEWLIRNPRCPMCKDSISNFKSSNSQDSQEYERSIQISMKYIYICRSSSISISSYASADRDPPVSPWEFNEDHPINNLPSPNNNDINRNRSSSPRNNGIQYNIPNISSNSHDYPPARRMGISSNHLSSAPELSIHSDSAIPEIV